MKRWVTFTALGALTLSGCLASSKEEKTMLCKVTRLKQPPKIDANWDKFPWREIQPQPIRLHMGRRPEHFPKAEVKIAYDAAALYLIFRVEDQYVRAVATDYQAPVCRDSCVEFFFSPGPGVSQGYFNLEMNCGGTTLFCFQRAPRKDVVEIPESEHAKITIAHSLPKIVDPEIATPVAWTVEYRLPIEILQKHCAMTPPAPGVVWRANFYKCGDQNVASPLADLVAGRVPETSISFAGILRRVGVRIALQWTSFTLRS